jgi:N-acetyl-gamma-glutamyl-phosphate/LysW-gamma-L-alpha-aminoadipyl-6-phosphate reductase
VSFAEAATKRYVHTAIPVAVLGAGGYAGGELLRILLSHPQAEVVLAASRTHAGKPLDAAHPNLDSAIRFEDAAAERAAERAEVVFLALGHGESIAAVRELSRARTIVDLSGDFRLATGEEYALAYGKKHEAPELLPAFVYGCPELARPGELAARRGSRTRAASRRGPPSPSPRWRPRASSAGPSS